MKKTVFSRVLAFALAAVLCLALAASITFASEEPAYSVSYIVGDSIKTTITADDDITGMIIEGNDIEGKTAAITKCPEEFIDPECDLVLSNIIYTGEAFLCNSVSVVNGAKVELTGTTLVLGKSNFEIAKDAKMILASDATAKEDEDYLAAVNKDGKYTFEVKGLVKITSNFEWNADTALKLTKNSDLVIAEGAKLTIKGDASISGNLFNFGTLLLTKSNVFLNEAAIVNYNTINSDADSSAAIKAARGDDENRIDDSVIYNVDETIDGVAYKAIIAGISFFYDETVDEDENVKYTLTEDIAGKEYAMLDNEHFASHTFGEWSAPAKYSEEVKATCTCENCGEKLYATLAKADITTKYTDISKTGWYYADEWIQIAVDNGFFKGTNKEQTAFSPERTMTRAEFVTVLANVAGADIEEYGLIDATFDDVAKDNWAFEYVEWAAANGITKGTSADTFAPDKAITREEAAVMLNSYIKASNKTLDENNKDPEITDIADISNWAKDAVKCCITYGLLGSTSTDKIVFAPKAGFSRAQGAVVFDNLAFAIDEIAIAD